MDIGTEVYTRVPVPSSLIKNINLNRLSMTRSRDESMYLLPWFKVTGNELIKNKMPMRNKPTYTNSDFSNTNRR